MIEHKPPRSPTNTLARKHYNEHQRLPYEFELVKQYLIDTPDRRAQHAAKKLKETK